MADERAEVDVVEIGCGLGPGAIPGELHPGHCKSVLTSIDVRNLRRTYVWDGAGDNCDGDYSSHREKCRDYRLQRELHGVDSEGVDSEERRGRVCLGNLRFG